MNHSHPPFYWFLCNHALLECVLFHSHGSISHVIACCNCFEKLKMSVCVCVWLYGDTSFGGALISLHNPSQLSDSIVKAPLARNMILSSFRREQPVLPIFLRGLPLLYLTGCLCHTTPEEWFTVAVTSDKKMSDLLLVALHFVVFMTCFQHSLASFLRGYALYHLYLSHPSLQEWDLVRQLSILPFSLLTLLWLAY